MSQDQKDIVRYWKDAQFRESQQAGESNTWPENPAGAIELPHVDASGGTGWPCALVGSEILSCFPSCEATVWDGTCNIASIGCCTPEGE